MSSYAAPQPLDITPLLQAIKAGQAGFAGLPKQALALANQDVGATVQGIQGQQAQIGQDAAQRAHEIAAASIAAARFLTSLHLGNAISGDYRQAAAAERAAAAGYSGGLQKTVAAAAAPVEANLQRIGAPGHAMNVGAQAGNYLYGLGGNLPAERLDIVGPTVAAGYRALPASTVAYGQQQAVGTIGAGQRQAASLNPAILAAEARRSTIAAGYLGKLQAAAETHGQHMFANALGALKLQQADNAASALAAYRQAQVNQAAQNAADLNTYRTGELGLARTNAATAQASAANAALPHLNVSASGRYGYQIDTTGRAIVGADGKPIPYPKTGGTGGGLTADTAASVAKSFAQVAATNGSGTQPHYQIVPGGTDRDPSHAGQPDSMWQIAPGSTGTKPLPYWQTVQQGVNMGLSRARAIAIVNTTPGYTEEGMNDRPYTGANAVAAAQAAARAAIAHQLTLAQAIAATTNRGLVDPKVFIPIFQKVYAASAAKAQKALTAITRPTWAPLQPRTGPLTGIGTTPSAPAPAATLPGYSGSAFPGSRPATNTLGA